MAGFVKEVIPRLEALAYVEKRMLFPWDAKAEVRQLREAMGMRIAEDVATSSPYPPYSRSLRDGYAVQSSDVMAATPGTPTFLMKSGQILMGTNEGPSVEAGSAVHIPTGAIIPNGADSVVMLEDTYDAGDWIEVRRGVQAGENIIRAGEDLEAGVKIACKGELIGTGTVSLLAAIGADNISVFNIRIGILSTGDEIVPIETKEVPPGCFRDVNGFSCAAMLKRYGFDSDYRGIVSDDGEVFESRIMEELDNCDVLILSGGSSVGLRDHSSRVLSQLPNPGLLVRGINIVPGKPTLIAGALDRKKLVISLPGHPLSCLTVLYTVVIPLLLSMVGAKTSGVGKVLRLPLSRDLIARTGPEEFVPCKIDSESVTPILAKSGYISVLSGADGFIRIPDDTETMRENDLAEVWTW
jgi:molybdopterin molybdotransferase